MTNEDMNLIVKANAESEHFNNPARTEQHVKDMNLIVKANAESEHFNNPARTEQHVKDMNLIVKANADVEIAKALHDLVTNTDPLESEQAEMESHKRSR